MNFCTFNLKPFEFTLNLAQAANTYDACTASNDLMVLGVNFYVSTVGAAFTSVAVQSNQTTAFTLMTSVEGAVANLLDQSHPTCTAQTYVAPWSLRLGQKIQYTIVGGVGTGELKMFGYYIPLVTGATLV